MYAITRLAYPDNLHMDDVHQTFRKLHRFLQGKSHAKEWVFHNDDLIGFYTSVPQERILKAIRHLLSTYLAVHPPTKNKIMFTVDLLQTQSNQRVFRRKTRKHAKHTYNIDFEDIQELVQMSLSLSYFVSMGVVYSQIRGSCIGSQISPTLCNITVAYEEVMWQKTFNVQLNSMGFFTRYVDNRMCIVPRVLPAISPLHAFLQLDFYGEPVTLEQVGDMHFLGFNVDLAQRTVSYITPESEHKYRSTHSAGSKRMALTGAVSRLHLICRNTFPRKDVIQACQALASKYIQFGASAEDFQACQIKILARYRLRMSK